MSFRFSSGAGVEKGSDGRDSDSAPHIVSAFGRGGVPLGSSSTASSAPSKLRVPCSSHGGRAPSDALTRLATDAVIDGTTGFLQAKRRRRIVDGSMVVAALKRPRGFIELEVMTTLAVVLGLIIIVIAGCAFAGHVLSERDRAREAAAAAESRANACAERIGALVVAADNLQRAVDLHLAIDDDACACWTAEQP